MKTAFERDMEIESAKVAARQVRNEKFHAPLLVLSLGLTHRVAYFVIRAVSLLTYGKTWNMNLTREINTIFQEKERRAAFQGGETPPSNDIYRHESNFVVAHNFNTYFSFGPNRENLLFFLLLLYIIIFGKHNILTP